jgi:hypothetical protein
VLTKGITFIRGSIFIGYQKVYLIQEVVMPQYTKKDSINVVEKIVESMQSRGYSINFSRAVLYGHAGITATSWGGLLKRSLTVGDKNSASIKQVYTETLLTGNKLCSIFQLNKDSLPLIRSWLQGLTIDSTNKFVAEYPYLISSENLKNETRVNIPVNVDEVNILGNKLICAQFCSREIYMKIYNASTSELTDSALQKYEEGVVESVKVTTRVNTQMFNSVILNESKNYLVIGVDTAGLKSAHDAEMALLRLKKLVSNKSGVKLTDPLNIFPSIEKMYKATSGRITKVDFITPNDNVSSMSIKPGQRDLRNDNYHKAGEAEVGDLDKFKVSKAWDFIIGDYERNVSPTISANGSKKQLHLGESLDYFYVSDCPSIKLFHILLNKAFGI